MVTKSFTESMLAFYGELERLGDEYDAMMPDEAIDALQATAASVRTSIIDAEITCAGDIANKLRLAAKLIETDGIEWPEELPAIERAAADLVAWRQSGFAKIGCAHPIYGPVGRQGVEFSH